MPPGTPHEQGGRDDLGIEDEVSKFDTELNGEDIEKPRSRMEWVLQGTSTHLNLAADVASAVDRGLRSARNIVRAAMNPSATGLNEAQTMIAETIKNLDSVAETMSDISGTADDVVKRMARNAEDRMKAQFAYMIDRIGGGKDLTEFSQGETDHLFAAMKDVWGKDAERLAEGKNPAVAKAIRQTYGKPSTSWAGEGRVLRQKPSRQRGIWHSIRKRQRSGLRKIRSAKRINGSRCTTRTTLSAMCSIPSCRMVPPHIKRQCSS